MPLRITSARTCAHALARTLAAALWLMACQAAHAQPRAPDSHDSMTERTRACTVCHGKEGRATTDGYFPRIAGKPAGYLYNQLLHFREGRRNNATMSYFVGHMSDAYLLDIARHYATLDLPYPPPQPAAEDSRTLARGRMLAIEGDAARGVPACAQCHGAALTGVAPAIPGLLGLPRDYLNAQFGAWRIGQRRAHEPDCMARVADQLSPEDVGAVTAWLAAQPVPASAKAADSLPARLPMPCGGVASQ